MEHLHPVSSGSWITFLIIGVIVLLIGLLIWLVSRKTIRPPGLTRKERKIFSGEQREILSFLQEKGEPVEQSEIIHIIFGDLRDGVEILKDMESKNLIHRHWDPQKKTYLISSKKSQSIQD